MSKLLYGFIIKGKDSLKDLIGTANWAVCFQNRICKSFL